MKQQVDRRPWSTCEMAKADTKALRCLDVPATLITDDGEGYESHRAGHGPALLPESPDEQALNTRAEASAPTPRASARLFESI